MKKTDRKRNTSEKDSVFEKRKKVIYDFICDDLYVPMKAKEIAAVLQVPKEQREDLRAVLDALEAEGKIFVSAKGKYTTTGSAKRHIPGL